MIRGVCKDITHQSKSNTANILEVLYMGAGIMKKKHGDCCQPYSGAAIPNDLALLYDSYCFSLNFLPQPFKIYGSCRHLVGVVLESPHDKTRDWLFVET